MSLNSEAWVALREGQGRKLASVRWNPLIPFILRIEYGEGDGLGARQEGSYLGKRREGVEFHDGVHPPIRPESPSGSRLIS